MKSKVNIILTVLLLGIILTGLSATRKNWSEPIQPCNYLTNNGLAERLARESVCNGGIYGYPQYFIQAKPSIGLNFKEPDQLDSAQISSVATIELKWTTLVLDIIFWSGVSFVILYLLSRTYNFKKTKKTKRKT